MQEGLIGGWGARPSKVPHTGQDIMVEIIAGGSGGGGGSGEIQSRVVVKGQEQDDDGVTEGTRDEEISDTEIESFILSAEEQKKK